MGNKSNSRDRERLALLEQKVELLLCLHCGLGPSVEAKEFLGEERWQRFIEAGERLRGYFSKTYVATGEGEFSILPVAPEPLFRIAQPACDLDAGPKTQTL